MDKILFLNEKDRNTGLSLEHSDYRYKTAKPVAATKPKHDEVGFTIPYAMFRPIREPGLLCELLGDNPVRRTADLKMNFWSKTSTKMKSVGLCMSSDWRNYAVG